MYDSQKEGLIGIVMGSRFYEISCYLLLRNARRNDRRQLFRKMGHHHMPLHTRSQYSRSLASIAWIGLENLQTLTLLNCAGLG